MILQRLVVENFRPYVGVQSFEFSPAGARNVTVIRGLNGTGKSSLFMALKWAFWGTAPVEQRNLVCVPAIKAAAEGEIVETRVDVTYEHEGRRFKVVRSFRSRVGAPLPEGEPSFAAEPTAQSQLFEIVASGEAKLVNTPFDELSRAVPRQAVDYFFFDAEQITRFAEDDTGVSIKEAIRHVLRFTELENAARHVDLARQEYARRLRSASGPGVTDLVEKREQLTARAAALRVEAARIAGEIEDARRLRDTYSGRLQELASMSKLVGQRAEARAKLAAAGQARQDALATAGAAIGGLALALATPAFQSARTTVDQRRQRGEIPAKVKSRVLRDWLESRRCICGRPLEEGSDDWNHIREELERSIPSRTEEELTSMAGSIDQCMRESARQVDGSTKALSYLAQARELEQAANDRIAELDAEIGSQPDEDVAAIAQNEKRLSQQIEDLSTRQFSNEVEAARSEEEVERLTQEIVKNENRNREAKRLEVRHDLAARSARALQDLRGDFEGDVREQIQLKVGELFPELIWKPQLYRAVTLSPDFKLEVFDRWNQPAFSSGETSMGESRILSLAFIVAMQVVARDSVDARTPTVVDSPFGNLSVEPIERVCSRLPALVDQLILFLTDADWQWAQPHLAPRLGRQYELAFNADESVTVAV